jgi:heterodisulfide reductase subunit B
MADFTDGAVSKRIYSYYPGCSLHSTGLEYGRSTRAVFQYLDAELVELAGWNCCGATSAHALRHDLPVALPARNLAQAQQAGHDLVAPCAACFNRMKNADYALRNKPDLRVEIEDMVGFQYQGSIQVLHILQALQRDYGAHGIAERVSQPLKGLKVATYYGCLLVRPPQITGFDDPDDPQVMGELLRAAGAEVVRWSYATECCGASLSLSRSGIVRKLVGRLVEQASLAGANAIVTACPLCQVNLEMRQAARPAMPTFYFTELLGLAFGVHESQTWWPKHLIDPQPLLRECGLV